MQYMGIDRAHSRKPRQQLQQFKIIQVIPVAHDIALDLAAIHPGDMVLHIARHQIRRVRDNLWATAHMTLLDIRHSLSSQHPPPSFFFFSPKERKKRVEKHTALIVSTIPVLTITTANLLLQNAETVTSRSTLDNPAPCSRDCFSNPIRHSLSSTSDSIFLRSGSESGSSWESLWASWRREPASAL